jgi:hypothetical protein
MDFGLGAIQSPPDERDFLLSQLYADTGVVPPATLPPSFRVAHPAPILDQGKTPQCVAYSTARMKMWQDRDDQPALKWHDFDEPAFFRNIGGTSQGAYLRAAMDRLLKVGYPVVGGTTPTATHRIKAYYAIPKSILDIKRAIFSFGTIVLATPWYNSWTTPKNGILPKPDYSVGGHAIDAEGWDDRYGLLVPNSWGTKWSPIHKGVAFMPYAYVTQCVWELFKTVDQ